MQSKLQYQEQVELEEFIEHFERNEQVKEL